MWGRGSVEQGRAGQGQVGPRQRAREAGGSPSHRLHLQLFPIHSLGLVEGGVGANHHEGGSCRETGSSGHHSLTCSPLPARASQSLYSLTQDPEDGRTRAGQPEEGEGDAPSQSVLMGWGHLSAWGCRWHWGCCSNTHVFSPRNPQQPTNSLM